MKGKETSPTTSWHLEMQLLPISPTYECAKDPSYENIGEFPSVENT